MGLLGDILKGMLGEATKTTSRSSARETPASRTQQDLRAKTLPVGFAHLIQGPALDVVGESNYRAKIQRAVGRAAEGHHDVVDAAMVWEPDNRYDPNAVAIQIGGVTCGYLARPDALRYRPVMERCRAEGFVPVVRADGWKMDDGTWADFGIKLYVASPEKLMEGWR